MNIVNYNKALEFFNRCKSAYILAAEILQKMLPSLNHFTDVGSNMGYYTSHILSRFPNATACLFEPMKESYEYGQYFLSSYGDQITHHNFGLSDVRGYLDIYTPQFCPGKEVLNGSFYKSLMPVRSIIETVNLKIFDYLDMPTGEFVKIDTEGYEAHVIRGMLTSISKQRPYLIIEIAWGYKIHPEWEFSIRMFDYLTKNLGYTCYDFRLDEFDYRMVDHTIDVIFAPNRLLK